MVGGGVVGSGRGREDQERRSTPSTEPNVELDLMIPRS